MNKSMVRFLLSKLLLIEAALLLVPLIVAFIYQESFTIIFSILATMAILILLGSIELKDEEFTLFDNKENEEQISENVKEENEN